MKDQLLEVTASGELPRRTLAVLGVLSLVLAVSCLYLVQASLPAHAVAAHLGLTLLFCGAVSGFLVVLQFLLKVFQGQHVRVRVPK